MRLFVCMLLSVGWVFGRDKQTKQTKAYSQSVNQSKQASSSKQKQFNPTEKKRTIVSYKIKCIANKQTDQLQQLFKYNINHYLLLQVRGENLTNSLEAEKTRTNEFF